MKTLLSTIAAVTLLSSAGAARADAGEYFELFCSRPHGYDLSIHVRNAYSQGGTPDNTFFLFLNGGYAGVDEVSAISRAFGKGDATFLYVDENAWDRCRFEAGSQAFTCAVGRADAPVNVLGRRDFEGPIETILQASRVELAFDRPDAATGRFVVGLTEKESGRSETFTFTLPCR